MAGIGNFECGTEALTLEKVHMHGYTWERMRDDAPLAKRVRDDAGPLGIDMARVKLWSPTDRDRGRAAVGVSMIDGDFDELESLRDIVRDNLSGSLQARRAVFSWQDNAKLPPGWFFDDDGEIAMRLAYECVGTGIDIEHVIRNVTTTEFAVIADTRKGKIHKIVEAGRRGFGPNFSVYETLASFAENIRKRAYDLSGVRMKVAEPKPAVQRPPTGYVYSREFGAGQVVCINGNEVTIDTERGRKTFAWTPPHDRVATPSEVSRVSATLAHRTALLCRERWATDGFGRPTAAFVEACGVVAAMHVEQGWDVLTVPVLLTHARLRMSLT